jgi:ketosteroid isomerase-like protein
LDDQYAINVAKTEMREGYKNADVDRILALFSDNFTDMREGQATFWGIDAKSALRATLEALFREQDVELTPIIIDILISGDVAVEHGWHRLTCRPKTGESTEVRRTRYVEIWRRGANGAWQIVLFMDNVDREPQLVKYAFTGPKLASETQEFDRH